MRCFHFSLDYYLLWVITAFLLWQWCVKSKILQKSAIVILLNLEQYQFPYYRHFILEEMHPLTCIWKVASFGLPTFNTCKSQTNFYLQEYLPACLNTWIVMQIELNSLVCSHVASSNMFLSMHIEHWNQLAWVWFCPVTAFSQHPMTGINTLLYVCIYVSPHTNGVRAHAHTYASRHAAVLFPNISACQLSKKQQFPHICSVDGKLAYVVCGMGVKWHAERDAASVHVALKGRRFIVSHLLVQRGGGGDTKGLISARWKKWCT